MCSALDRSSRVQSLKKYCTVLIRYWYRTVLYEYYSQERVLIPGVLLECVWAAVLYQYYSQTGVLILRTLYTQLGADRARAARRGFTY